MGVKVKWTVKKDLLDQMKRNAAAVSGTAVEVGAFEGSHAWLAGIHEWGCDIPVTDKMRGWLGAHGLHLNKNTTHIHIPERSFLRAGYDMHGKTVTKHAALLLADVAAGRISPANLYEAVGTELSDRIKEFAIDLNSPSKHPFTLEQGGGSNPLVQTGDMIGGITWRTGKL